MSLSAIIGMYHEQKEDLPILATEENCSGKTCIVTGSNIGVGLETAKHLVRASAARVILAVRNVKVGEEAKSEIDNATGRKGVAEVWHLDLASYTSVQAFAKRAATELERIDCLVENAAIALDQWTLSEAMETSATVNILSTMLLAVMLLPKMIESGRRFGFRPRLVFLTSGAGFSLQRHLENIKDDVLGGLADKAKADMDARYGLTKLVELYCIRELSDLVTPDRTGLVINMTNPGLCNSGLDRNARLATRLQIGVLRVIMGRTSEMGARTVLHGIVGGEETHGKFLSGCQVKEHMLPDWVTNADGQRMQKQIWGEVSRKLEQVQPGCVSNIL
ncbi:hypothetical protein BJ170DRAFT_629600 [Xylariales sp. AK1849]|nr:hypothetical protein BJ170DRAFT_629600 [Xylariales sp. AK1849]